MTHKRLTYIESVVLAGLVLLFATATYQRNFVWKDDDERVKLGDPFVKTILKEGKVFYGRSTGDQRVAKRGDKKRPQIAYPFCFLN